ncbi:MAG: hypothetical protein HN849_16150 [Victivallales bacterium]|jgi:hypothetical protein|nr:hypothetical protein [Victivallales bacterium]
MDDISHLVFDEMVRTFSRSPFVLFLGAGVNGDTGVRWSKLVSALEEKAFHMLSSGDNELAKSLQKFVSGKGLEMTMRAELVARTLGPSAYRLFLKRELYSNFSYGEFTKCMGEKQAGGRHSHAEKYHFLWLAAKLTQSANLVAVLTLNYDNFLEMAIEALPISDGRQRRAPVCMMPARPLAESTVKGRRKPGDIRPLPVYHLHGFLPYLSPDLAPDSQDIVLSQNDYLRSMRESMSAGNCTAVHMLTSYPVLFVGLSMNDWNLLRHIEASQVAGRGFSHFRLGRQTNAEDPLQKAALLYDRMVGQVWNMYGVKSITAGTDYKHMRKVLEELVDSL